MGMRISESLNLSKSFKSCFEIVPALTDTLRKEVFRVRHKVYCEELQYEAIRSNKLEIDEYDAHALHLLIRNSENNEFIGCTRIIRPQSDNPGCFLPFEKLCEDALDRAIVNPLQFSRHKIGEVSRLAVISSYRRRKGDYNREINISDEDYGTLNRPRFPYIPIALYFGTVELARINNIDYLFLLTEDRLANHFRKLGADIRIIGDPIEHHGKRVPSMLDVNQVVNDIRSIFRPLYLQISADIAKYTATSRK